jgi:hypothetical protein
VLHPLASGHYLSPRVVNLALQYLTRALELKGTYKLMKPHVEPLLSQVRGSGNAAAVFGAAPPEKRGSALVFFWFTAFLQAKGPSARCCPCLCDNVYYFCCCHVEVQCHERLWCLL